MTEAELIATLRIDAATLAAWIDEGLPCTGRGAKRRFDVNAVGVWLLDNGKARQQRLVSTVAEVAAYLELSERRVHALRKPPHNLPGEPGRFDLDAIDAWSAARPSKKPADEDTARARQAEADAKLKELKAAKMAGTLYEVEPARRLIIRLVNEACAILDQLPDRVFAALPTAPGKKGDWQQARRQIRTKVSGLVVDVRKVLAELPESKEFGGEGGEGKEAA